MTGVELWAILGPLVAGLGVALLSSGSAAAADADRSRWRRSAACRTGSDGSERGGQLGALLDRPLGVELGGHVGAADQVRRRPRRATRSSYRPRTDSWPAHTTTWSTVEHAAARRRR